MKVVALGAGVKVVLGELFAVERENYAASGYLFRAEIPAGVVHVGTDTEPATGFGGASRALERFRCEREGDYRLVFVEGRPWEEEATTSVVIVRCR